MKLSIPIAIIFVIGFVTTVSAHEPHGYKHLEKDEFIGPHIMSARFCPGSSEHMMWIVDKDKDDIADECNQVFGGHQTVHFKRWTPSKIGCVCKEKDYGIK